MCLRLFETISTATDRLTARPAGTLVVNAEPLFAAKWLVPRLNAFHTAHPEIEIRLETSTGLADVARYEADIAIRFLAVAGSDPDAILLSDAPVYPYAAPSLIAAAPDDPAELLRYPRLRDRYKDTWAIWAELAGLPSPQTDPAWRMRAHLAIEAALAGQGVYLVSSEVVAQDVATGRLHRVSDIGFCDGGFYLKQAEGGTRRKAVRIFSDWLLEQAAPWRRGVFAEDKPNG
ncbi:LysR substrate-binding domain-containing protein [Pseudosulfitobacter koreensis]|uniref:LysR substrate-binding domain-containing protein n=1 Tax=Pseudosulfitobacter koreensis TaxID=2968472 RepID=A0ABT1YVS5_9RHOB|nr:LysR substrate-binding domain-containing protein [Pseudosulfitobacter koreense]MCR8824982.1 LysR substrate-binding domain-containing protein [Pseudosulfitobacter koreense]